VRATARQATRAGGSTRAIQAAAGGQVPPPTAEATPAYPAAAAREASWAASGTGKAAATPAPAPGGCFVDGHRQKGDTEE
jgi:hypothetical protein